MVVEVPRRQRLVAVATLALLLTTRSHAVTLFTVASDNTLRRFDSADPAIFTTIVSFTGLQPSEQLLALDFRPADGRLYAPGSTSRLYIVDTTTGIAAQVGSAGAFTLSGNEFGFDFNPTVDRIRIVSDQGQNIRLNPDTGALAATDTPLSNSGGGGN